MEKVTIEFNHQPPILPVLYQALFLPRKGVKANQGFPEIEGKLNKIKIDHENLKKYCELCEIPESDFLPILYPHVLAGVVHLHVLTHPQFPIKLMGAIHKYNIVNMHRQIKKNETLDIHAKLASPRYYSKGVEFDLITEVYSNSELVWSEISTYFVRKSFGAIKDAEDIPFLTPVDCNDAVASWQLSILAGKKYAMICKDFNPIHISSPLAKLFGFKRDLVHGMCSAAQCLAKIDNIQKNGASIKIYFKGPSYMGSTLKLMRSSQVSGRYDLYCGKNDRPVISMQIEE